MAEDRVRNEQPDSSEDNQNATSQEPRKENGLSDNSIELQRNQVRWKVKNAHAMQQERSSVKFSIVASVVRRWGSKIHRSEE